MSGRSDLPAEMPNLPWNRAATDLTREERSFEALLSGAPLPADPPADNRLVAELVSALGGPAAADELHGFGTTRAAYMTRFAPQPRHGRNLRWRPAMLGTLLSSKIAAALAAGVVGIGGLSAAAYAGTLPDTAQSVAHDLIGAPDGHPGKGHGNGHQQSSSPTSTPVGPDATDQAAYGLCTAYENAKTHGQSIDKSVAFKNLATTAGGAAKIDAYCAKVPHPSSSLSPHPTGKPSALPSQASGHATGKPSALPSQASGHATGMPSQLPTHPAGKPSNVPTGPPTNPNGH
jgi:hypothetical protein